MPPSRKSAVFCANLTLHHPIEASEPVVALQRPVPATMQTDVKLEMLGTDMPSVQSDGRPPHPFSTDAKLVMDAAKMPQNKTGGEGGDSNAKSTTFGFRVTDRDRSSQVVTFAFICNGIFSFQLPCFSDRL
jgi:hypothetical protein